MKPLIKLNKQGLKSFLRGKPWFSKKEIKDFSKYELSIEPGSIVKVFSHQGVFLGIGYFNPEVFWCLKLLAREDVEVNEQFFYEKFKSALELRKSFYPNEKAFRLVFADGDYLPGLIVDVFNRVLVVQTFTKGMEKLLPFVVGALKKLFNPEAVVLKNDAEKRKEEGLQLYVEVEGKLEEPILLEMDGIKFLVNFTKAQKTGFFLDQRENRRYLKNIASEKVIIDAFCYTGGFGFYALKGGAKKVFFLDRSSLALEVVEEVAKLNGWKDKIILLEGDVFNLMQGIPQSDILVLDPPAFIKSKKHFSEGLKKYKRLYSLALNHIEKGLLFGFSCSSFLKLQDLVSLLSNIGAYYQRNIKILYTSTHPPDHPVNPFLEESSYLKGVLCYVE